MSAHYRDDIDGLRAISVVAVVAYHLSASYAPGGFIGVDVFFVISGFLISRYIYQNCYAGTFSIVDFYERRARRILPAYAAVSAVVAVVAFFVLLPADLAQFGRSLVATTLFAGNIFFYATSDYFAPDADTQLLLHYWSLGVEEQFYIFFPLIILATARFAPRLIPVVVAVILLVSLVAAEFLVGTRQEAVFYLLPYRAWEMMVGAALALPGVWWPRRAWISAVAALAGLAAIGVSVAWFRTDMRFPGASALLPCLGAALVLWGGGGPANLVKALLSIAPMRFLGRISYSLYLVHWPVIVFSNELFPRTDTLASHAIEATVAVALAYASFRLVEQPFRVRRQFWTRPRLFAASAAAMVVIASAGAVTSLREGFPSRLPEDAQRILAYASYQDEMDRYYQRGVCFVRGIELYKADKCIVGGPEAAILWGDSFGAHYQSSLAEALEARGLKLGQASVSGCRPLLKSPRKNARCDAFSAKAFELITTAKPAYVILAANWLAAENPQLAETVKRLTNEGIKVIVFGPGPSYWGPLPEILAKRILVGDRNPNAGPDLRQGLFGVDAAMRRRFGQMDGVTFISMVDSACPDRRCPALVDGAPTNWDAGHLTLEGSRWLIGAIADQLPMAPASIKSSRLN